MRNARDPLKIVDGLVLKHFSFRRFSVSPLFWPVARSWVMFDKYSYCSLFVNLMKFSVPELDSNEDVSFVLFLVAVMVKKPLQISP